MENQSYSKFLVGLVIGLILLSLFASSVLAEPGNAVRVSLDSSNAERNAASVMYTVISASYNHTCAVTSNGGAKCWGSNGVGELGDGTYTNSNVPVDVSDLSNGISVISAGYDHTCALTTTGGVKCWGSNFRGQLGNGTNTDSNVPVDVSGFTSGVISISAGSGHTCALTSAGIAKCWGYNYYGQLGNGTNIDSNVPVDVINIISGVSFISAGANHTCASTSVGGAKCWGINFWGQLGNGTNTDSNIPVNVSGLTSDIISVSAGANHTCAISLGGGAKCWGWNGYGQLGDGTNNNSNIPVDVVGSGFIPSLLDLPFEYTNFSEAANGYYGDKSPGQVMSWFDHNSIVNAVTIWSGTKSSGAAQTNVNTCASYDRAGCYDGHNGIDFRNTLDNENAYAAANGKVFGVVNNCQTCLGDCTGYGNRVWIDHHNGYATLYGHLNMAWVTNGEEISDRLTQPLGVIGCTGYSTGPHLHFGLYFDQNGDGIWSESEAVDPYGYQGANYFWIHPLSDRKQIDSSGGSLSDTSGNITVTVPAGAITDPITLELWDTPPIADASAAFRSTGNSLWMRVMEWLPVGSNALLLANASTNSFDVPVTVFFHYDPSWMMHLDTNQLTIYQWDEVNQLWAALSTTLDPVIQQATAQTTQPGYFDLQAPLVCPADINEPNDSYNNASFLQTDGTSVNNLFDIAVDEDWFKFGAWAGGEYNIQTTNLAAGVDTVFELYGHDGVTLLATDDNSGGGNASSLTWQAPAAGTYFVRVRQAVGSAYGCNASYNFSILSSYKIYQPLVIR